MWDDKTIKRDNSDSAFFRRVLLYARRKTGERFFRENKNAAIRRTLGDAPFSLFSNNCMGGVFYHDAGRQFNSPTINMAIDGEDFIKFLERPRYYAGIEDFVFVHYPDLAYPVARLDDIEIRFVHYHSQEECMEKWISRSSRIDWDNIFIVGTDRDGLYKPELLERFNKLPYKNKLLFTAQDHPEYSWAIQLPEFKKREQVGIASYYADFKGNRYYETRIDLAKWIAERSRVPKDAQRGGDRI